MLQTLVAPAPTPTHAPTNRPQPCLYECKDCPFRGPVVGSRGDPLSPLLIIGESPGKHEVEKGLPFVGPSGLLLDKTLKHSGLSIEPYYINALQCSPPSRDDKDESIMSAGVTACRHHVFTEIEKAPRRIILALGASALHSISGDHGLKITQERGKFLTSPHASIGYVPSVHPAFLMSGGKGGTFQQFTRDIQYAVDLLNGLPPKKPPTVQFEVAQSYKDLHRWSRLFKNYYHTIASDVETGAFQPLQDGILCMGFAPTPNYVYIIPEHLVKYADMFFQLPDISFVWHNGQFDIKHCWHARLPNARVDEDTILLSYSLDENGGIHGLEQVSSDWLNSPNWKAVLDSYLPTKRTSSYRLIPRDILHHYMALDIGNTRAVYDILRARVQADKHLEKLYTRTLIPATNFLAKVEQHGLHVDLERLKQNHISYSQDLTTLREKLLTYATPFPLSGYTDKLPGSPKQLNQLIYDDLKIRPYKNKRTTDKKFLDKLDPHPFLDVLRKYRKLAKEYGTYVKSIANYDPITDTLIPGHLQRDGKVHSSISLFKTRTGRLASNDPNVQNVPRNPQIRGQYVAPPNRRLVEVDLNQAELRILACLSGDPTLCHIYLTKGMSIHDEVRADIWGWPKDYSPSHLQIQLRKFRLTEQNRYDEHGTDLLIAEQKMRAKNVNFGTVYGITPPGLAEQCDCTIPEAQEMLDKWRRKFPIASAFLDQCKNAPFNGQTLITPFGNKKRPGVVSQELAHAIQNEFANFPEQCCASHCTLHSGIEIHSTLASTYDSYICNLIHDALLIDTPDDDTIARQVATVTKAKMEEIPRKWGFTRVPFVAEAKQGYRWGSLKGMKDL